MEMGFWREIIVYRCNLYLLTIKQGYQIVHRKIVASFIILYLSNKNTTSTSFTFYFFKHGGFKS